MKKISVVIPARNEEKNIKKVINLIKKCEYVDEIIVVNNNSTDKTEEKALECGVKVVLCKKVGKGYAMELGLKNVSNDIVLYSDADVSFYKEGFIENMVEPLINDECDFVKTAFDREGGRVTSLVVKPLLELLFPKLSPFKQPLSGMIASKKEVLDKIVFEKDYGVDIGILIDVYKLEYRIQEVDIGKLKNDCQDWKNLIDMSRQVTSSILKRASFGEKKVKAKIKFVEDIKEKQNS